MQFSLYTSIRVFSFLGRHHQLQRKHNDSVVEAVRGPEILENLPETNSLVDTTAPVQRKIIIKAIIISLL